jgi:hypothetical protein
VAMLNMDMVGRLEGDPLIVNGTGTATEWDGILDELETRLEIPLTRAPDGFGPSDHTSFYARGVPVLHFFTNVHGQYHRPSDEWRLIDEDGLQRIAVMVAGVVLEVGNRTARITPLAGAGTPPQERQGGGGDRSYLGSIPDFAPVEYGVRFSGVTAGSPADEAGMVAGDILIRLGDHEIDDLYALTAALERLRPGDAVAAVVVRGGEPLTLQVVIGSR